MNAIWRNLLWREWHEHKWKLVALSAIMLSVQSAAIWGDPQMVALSGQAATLCAIVPLAIFVGMRTAAGERSEGTLAFVRSLPAKRSQMAAVKAIAGASTLLLSVFVALLAPLVWLAVLRQLGGGIAPQGPFKRLGPFETLVGAGLLASGLAASVFCWTLACGVNKSTEIRAGLSAAAVLLGAAALKLLELEFQPAAEEPAWSSLLFRGCNEVGPLGFASLFAPHAAPWRVVLLQLASGSVAFGWFAYRYGRDSGSQEGLSFEAAPCGKKYDTQPQSIGSGWRSMVIAIAWKQWRESKPFCLAGLLLTVCLTGWLLLMQGTTHFLDEDLVEAALNVGVLASILAGVGAFINELQPGLYDFWRSRPIGLASWFWTKYFTGLTAVSALVVGPAALFELLFSSGSFPGGKLIATCLPLLLLSYGLAVCLTCWLRHAVHAGIVAFAATFTFFVLPFKFESLAFWSIGRVVREFTRLTPSRWFTDVYLPFVSGMLALVAVTALLAWAAVRFDLGAHRLESLVGRMRLSQNRFDRSLV